MNEDFQILAITIVGRRITARVPLEEVMGHEQSQLLRADCVRLAGLDCDVVELDLRHVVHVDGTCFTRLLELRSDLQRRSIELEIRVSGNLLQIIRFTKLDRMLQVIDDPDFSIPRRG